MDMAIRLWVGSRWKGLVGLLNPQLEQILSDGGQLKEGKNVCMITSEISEEILLIMLHYHLTGLGYWGFKTV